MRMVMIDGLYYNECTLPLRDGSGISIVLFANSWKKRAMLFTKSDFWIVSGKASYVSGVVLYILLGCSYNSNLKKLQPQLLKLQPQLFSNRNLSTRAGKLNEIKNCICLQ